MCGIIGIINKNPEEFIYTANALIKHRGPDDEGVYFDEKIALGHQRLSIVDLSKNGHQPMFSPDNSYVIVYNGEIYNHSELRKTLEGKYKFNSTSDTETLLYGLIEFGEKFIEKLNGIFAFAFYNINTGEIIIARDQFGIKPLYFYNLNNEFWFGSEIKSFLANPNLNKSLDNEALFNYIYLLWSPNQKTPFINVKKLEAGHYLKFNVSDVINNIKISSHKYFEIPFEGIYYNKTEVDLINELEVLLLKAVERQLMSDVPLGFFLSGGLDSSTLVALAKKIRPHQKLKCYTIKSDNNEDEGFSNDLFYARKVAKHLDIELIEIEIEVDVLNEFDKMIYYLDEPQADIAPLNVLKICEAAKKDGIKVLLGGTGGDELFSGYRRHQAINFEKYFKFIPVFIATFLEFISKALPQTFPIFRRIIKIINQLKMTTIERLSGYFGWLPLENVRYLFKQPISYSPLSYFLKLYDRIPFETNLLNKVLFWDMKTFLPDHNLNYTDKLSMATGVEVRVPFLDIELVNFACKIPPELKLKGMTTKYILRKLMEKYLPKEVIYRPKAGFGAPVRKWIIEDLDILIQERLSRKTINAKGIFNAEKVLDLIEQNKKGKIDASYSILALLAIDSWLNQFNTYSDKLETNHPIL